MECTLKIRRLTRKDRKTVTKMISKMLSAMDDKGITRMISRPGDAPAVPAAKDAKDDAFSVVGINIIKLLLETLEDDVSAWFADLCGMTVEEFDNAPLDADLQVIELLKQQPEVSGFFSRASRLYKGINISGITSMGANATREPITE